MRLKEFAHGFDRSGAWIGSFESIKVGGCLMRNQDLVSDGFLALTAAKFALLCSSLLAFAYCAD
jgi:hypothetical protein